MTENITCPVCQFKKVQIIHEIRQLPAHIGILWDSRQEALNCPKGDITLAFCRHCGLLWNPAFDESLMEYSGPYDNSLHFSPFYQDYAQSQVDRLVRRYRLYEKLIIEIGSGRGDFLAMLCEAGNNRGIGFDPSYDGEPLDERITLIQDYYSGKYTHYAGDLICSRYVLEHIPAPVEFLKTIRSAIGDREDTVVYFELPNVMLILENLSVWDIIYEHCCYFGLSSLNKSFEFARFRPLHVYDTYEGQFVCIEAQPAHNSGEVRTEREYETARLQNLIDRFSHAFDNVISQWQSSFENFRKKNQKTVIWGAGAKGVSFLNMLKLTEDVEFVVDINPRKEGHFIPGTGQQIIMPDELKSYRPDNVIIMNPVYREEIRKQLNSLGLKPELHLAS